MSFISYIVGIVMMTNTINMDSSRQIAMKDPLYDNWIEQLAQHENCPITGLVDSNGVKSYGPYCFQMLTFKGYVRGYGLLQDATDEELYNWISDKDFGRKLIKLMLNEDYENWRHWRNTVINKIGYPIKDKCSIAGIASNGFCCDPPKKCKNIK